MSFITGMGLVHDPLLVKQTLNRSTNVGRKSMGRIRLGVAGLGMGYLHARAALKSRHFCLAAVADPAVHKRDERLASLGRECEEGPQQRELKKVRIFDDYEEMVTSGDIDALVVALPNTLHAPASIYAMKHGVHVLCEKPPTNTTAEMKRVAKAATESGCTYMFARQQRFEAGKDAVRKLVDGGTLGRIYHAEASWIRQNCIPYRHGWGVNKDHGGGVLLDLGVHKLDDAWYLMGCPQPVSAYAAMHCGFAHTAVDMKLDVPYNADDASFGIVKFANGASILIKVTFALHTPGPGDIAPEDMSQWGWEDMRLFGEQGGVDMRLGLVTSQRRGKVVRKPLTLSKARKARGMQGQIEEFGRAIRTGTEPLNTAAQAVALMQMLDALRRSGDTGRSVTIKAFDA